ncbi:MAG: hypothetical protein AAF658_22780, partial [Myxococcota bacterium]
MSDKTLRRETQTRVTELIARCAGVRTTLRANDPTVIPGETVTVNVDTAVQRPASDVRITGGVLALHGREVARFNKNGAVDVAVPSSESMSAIDWLAKDPSTADWSGLGTHPLMARLTLKVGAAGYEIERPVVFPNVDPVLGERAQAVRVEPTFTVTPAQPVTTLLPGRSQVVMFSVRANTDAARGSLTLELPERLTAAPLDQPLTFARAGEEQLIGFEITAGQAEPATIYPRVDDVRAWSRTYIDYSHLAPTVVLEPARLHAVPIDLDTSGVKGPIAYVQGTGDRVAELLDAVGLNVELVEPADLVPEKLERFHAVMLGVRAFNV